MSKAMNLQDTFLNQLRKENVGVTIYLNGNVQLKGYVRGFDAFSILFESPGKPVQLIYKHAVLAILPAEAVAAYRPQAGKVHAEEHS